MMDAPFNEHEVAILAISDGIRRLLQIGYTAQAVANRLGPLIDTIAGDLADAKQQKTLRKAIERGMPQPIRRRG